MSLRNGVNLIHRKSRRRTMTDRAAFAEEARVRQSMGGRTPCRVTTGASRRNRRFRVNKPTRIDDIQPSIRKRDLLRTVDMALRAIPPVAWVADVAEIDWLLAKPKNDIRALLVLAGMDAVNQYREVNCLRGHLVCRPLRRIGGLRVVAKKAVLDFVANRSMRCELNMT